MRTLLSCRVLARQHVLQSIVGHANLVVLDLVVVEGVQQIGTSAVWHPRWQVVATVLHFEASFKRILREQIFLVQWILPLGISGHRDLRSLQSVGRVLLDGLLQALFVRGAVELPLGVVDVTDGVLHVAVV